MTKSLLKKTIWKFEFKSCLNDRPRSGQQITNANAARTVQEEMKFLSGLSTHEEVSITKIAPRIDILYTTVRVALRRLFYAICTKLYIIINCCPAIL